MTKASNILGLNARQEQYKSLNPKKAKKIANSKLLTKKYLREAGVAVPELFAVIDEVEQVRQFDFTDITTSFVIKPSAGSGGKGILIVRKKIKGRREWLGIGGNILTEDDLRLHVEDILDGQYSTFKTKHRAFVEERVPRHSKFKKYAHKGTPDIRVLVYNRVPVMAMLRLPTKDSEGRANLHQGAIGVGVDIATGITLKGVRNGKQVRFVPGTKKKLNGLKIPKWSLILSTAVASADAVGLKFGGVDILLHKEKGPMVVELNQSPGLGIQIANMSGLRWRLYRVEGVNIRSAEHGVKVGQALFAERFADKVKADEGLVIVDAKEKVKIRLGKKNYQEVEALVDTGADRSSIDMGLATELGLMSEDNVLWQGYYSSALGRHRRKVVGITYYLKNKKIKTAVSVADRSKRKMKMLIGRRDLQGFLVNPQVV